MIGRAAFCAATGTYPTSASPRAMEPTAKAGSPSTWGSPTTAAGAAASVVMVRGGDCTCVDMGLSPPALPAMDSDGRRRAREALGEIAEARGEDRPRLREQLL